MMLIEHLLGLSLRARLLVVIDAVAAAILLLLVLSATIAFAERPDAVVMSNIITWLSLVWAIGALIERRRS